MLTHQPSDAAHGAREIERITTPDGGTVALKRRPGRRDPVILLHGIMVNADIWDLPDIVGADFHYRSLATLLNEAGFDVWLPNLRGHGWPDAHSLPPPGQRDWCVDHFILQDLPALVAHVCQRTGRAPFLGGCSMGAMAIAAYLQGARAAGPNGARRIVADADLAARRQAGIRGALLVEFPAALRWPDSIYTPTDDLRWVQLFGRPRGADSNYVFEIAARRRFWIQMLSWMRRINLYFLRPRSNAATRRAREPAILRRLRSRMNAAYAEGCRRLFDLVKGTENFCPETFLNGLLLAVDHIQAGVLLQYAECVRQRNFVSALGQPPHAYSDHYHLIHCPALTVLGGRDRIANPQVARELFCERIHSADCTVLEFENMAHGEFEYAPIATQRVFPRIVDWIETRAKH